MALKREIRRRRRLKGLAKKWPVLSLKLLKLSRLLPLILMMNKATKSCRCSSSMLRSSTTAATNALQPPTSIFVTLTGCGEYSLVVLLVARKRSTGSKRAIVLLN